MKPSYYPKSIATLGRQQMSQTERILHYLMHPELDHNFLSDADLRKLDRVNYADDQFRRYGNQAKVRKMLQRKYGVSHGQSSNDLRDMQIIHGTRQIIDKDYYRSMLADLQMKVFRKAMGKGNYTEANKAIGTMVKILRLDADDISNVKDLQQHEYYMIVDTGVLSKKINLGKAPEISEEARKQLVEAMHCEAMDMAFEEITKPDPE